MGVQAKQTIALATKGRALSDDRPLPGACELQVPMAELLTILN
jgi:hypothetical protein